MTARPVEYSYPPPSSTIAFDTPNALGDDGEKRRFVNNSSTSPGQQKQGLPPYTMPSRANSTENTNALEFADGDGPAGNSKNGRNCLRTLADNIALRWLL